MGGWGDKRVRMDGWGRGCFGGGGGGCGRGIKGRLKGRGSFNCQIYVPTSRLFDNRSLILPVCVCVCL